MEIEKLIDRHKNVPLRDFLGMMLSNRIDRGSSEGGMISVKAFDEVVGDIETLLKKAWFAGKYSCGCGNAPIAGSMELENFRIF